MDSLKSFYTYRMTRPKYTTIEIKGRRRFPKSKFQLLNFKNLIANLTNLKLYQTGGSFYDQRSPRSLVRQAINVPPLARKLNLDYQVNYQVKGQEVVQNC